MWGRGAGGGPADNLSRMLDTRPYVCRIIHPLFRTLVDKHL